AERPGGAGSGAGEAGSGRVCQPERGANQSAGEPDGDDGLRYGRKVPEGGAALTQFAQQEG
ncbi:hypothetical protein, partial [Klebsiella aerogenes]